MDDSYAGYYQDAADEAEGRGLMAARSIIRDTGCEWIPDRTMPVGQGPGARRRPRPGRLGLQRVQDPEDV